MDMRKGRRRTGERGVALLLTLLVLTVLIFIIFQMTFSASVNRHISQNYINDLQNSYAIRSGYAIATLYLAADGERSADVDSVNEPWAQAIQREIGASSLTASITDESGKIDVSALVQADGKVNANVKGMLTRLVTNFGFQEKNVDAIIDYIDGDTAGEFETGAKNGPLLNKEELLRIKGLEEGLLLGIKEKDGEKRGIMDFITIWPVPEAAKAAAPPAAEKRPPEEKGKTPQPQQQPAQAQAGQVNVNTAPAEALMALDERITAEIAQAIVAYRSQKTENGELQAFKQVDELQKVPGITPEIVGKIKPLAAVKSSIFTILCTAVNGSLTKSHIYVVKRTGSVQPPVTLLYSQRQHSFPLIPPPAEEEGK